MRLWMSAANPKPVPSKLSQSQDEPFVDFIRSYPQVPWNTERSVPVYTGFRHSRPRRWIAESILVCTNVAFGLMLRL